jgi:cell division septation protein DedD
MTFPDRSWIVVGLGLIATAIVAAALGSVVTLWAIDKPVPDLPAAPAAPAVPAAPAAPEPAPAPPPPPPPPPAETAGPPPSPAAEPAAAVPPPVDADALAAQHPYAVQLGAFAEPERAEHLAKILSDQGYPAQVEIHKSPQGHEMHYVRLVEGYDGVADAARQAALLKRKLDIDAIPVRRRAAGPAP